LHRLSGQIDSIRGFILAKDALPKYMLYRDSGRLGDIIRPFDDEGNTWPDQLSGYFCLPFLTGDSNLVITRARYHIKLEIVFLPVIEDLQGS